MSLLDSDSQMNSVVKEKKKKKNKHQRKSIDDDVHVDEDSFLIGVEKNWRQECENFAQKETCSGSSRGLLSDAINSDLLSQKSLFELNSSLEVSPRKKNKHQSGSKSISHQQVNDEVTLEQSFDDIRSNDFLSSNELKGHNNTQKIEKIKSRSEGLSLTDSEMNQNMSKSVVIDNSESEGKKKKKRKKLISEVERTNSDSIQTSQLNINKMHNETCGTDASKLHSVGFTILDNLSVNLKNIAQIVSSTTEPANKHMNSASKNSSKQNFEQECSVSSSSLSLPVSSQKKLKKEKQLSLEKHTMKDSILNDSESEKDENDEIPRPESLSFSQSISAMEKKKKKKSDKLANHGVDESINTVDSPVFYSMSDPLSCKSQKKRKRVISESSIAEEADDNALTKKIKFSGDDNISMTVNYNLSPEMRFHKKHAVNSPVLEIFSDDELHEVPDQQRSAEKEEKGSISSVTITQRNSSPRKNHLTLTAESQTELNERNRQSDRYDFKLEHESSNESSDDLPCGSTSSNYLSALESQTNSQPDLPRPGTSGYSRRMVQNSSSSPDYFTAKSPRYADSEVENSSVEENENSVVKTEHATVVEVFNISDDESREIEPGELLSPKRKKKSKSNNAEKKTISDQTKTTEENTRKPERIITAEPVEFHDRNTISQQYWKDVYNSLDEKGISYSTGKWSFDEIEQLKYNWENIVKDCPFKEPHRLLAKRLSDVDNMEIRKLTKYIDETKFYIQLGYGIRRSLYVIYLRARTLFIPGNRLGRKKQRMVLKSVQLATRRLKPDAVPSIFPNAPAYLSIPPKQQRSNSTTTSARSQKEEESLKLLEDTFLLNNQISVLSLSEVRDRLLKEQLPQGFIVDLNESLNIFMLTTSVGILKVRCNLTINEDKSFSCFVHQKNYRDSEIDSLCTSKCSKLESIEEILNILALIKSKSDIEVEQSSSFYINQAISNLQMSSNCSDIDDQLKSQITFIREQLGLLTCNKHARAYSPELVIFAYIIYSSSAAAYKVLLQEQRVILPSIETLNKITRKVDSKTGLNNFSYLQLRTNKLNSKERTMILMIDEIYVAKRIEYSTGNIQGLTSNGQVASTLLCFMIKSITSKYKDVVRMHPVKCLTAQELHRTYLEVMKLLTDLQINVVALSVDNAAVNRKFYTDYLCKGTLSSSIIHPHTGQPLFLLFDPVHNIKNIYNNFVNRKIFVCPPMDRNLPEGCSASFQHIEELYRHEELMPVKKAYLLSPASINPKSIEKLSMKLSSAVFSESTRNALSYYANHEHKDNWRGTVEFLSLIIKLWNILNVKTQTKGYHKREISMDPVRSAGDWKLQFLREFANFLTEWEKSGKKGLSRETFLATRQTCRAIADCSQYLIQHCGFSFILLGQLQSDDIESRFGWLRQMSGANYFVSVKQVMDSDRKIKALSLLKFSGYSICNIDCQLENQSADCSSSLVGLADDIIQKLSFSIYPTSSDANIVYYIAGALSRSVVRINKCIPCSELLIQAGELDNINIDSDVDTPASTFLDDINRGGLSKPSEYSFNLAISCWRVFEEIKQSADLTKEFLSTPHVRDLFLVIMDESVDCESHIVQDNFCVNGHDLKRQLIGKFFNCLAKNLVKSLSNNEVKSKSKSNKRKLSKLSNSTSQLE